MTIRRPSDGQKAFSISHSTYIPVRLIEWMNESNIDQLLNEFCLSDFSVRVGDILRKISSFADCFYKYRNCTTTIAKAHANNLAN